MANQKRVILVRLKDSGQTTGRLLVLDERHNEIFSCVTLEPPWINNEINISCIPPGVYFVSERQSEKFRRHYIANDVPGRTFILFHPGNFVESTRGCILVGASLRDINGDGLWDSIKSRWTFWRFRRAVGASFVVEIIDLTGERE